MQCYAATKRRRLTRVARAQLKAALGKMISLLLMLAMIAPVLVIVPGVGGVVVVLPIMAIAIIALYGLESWEILKTALERAFKTFAKDFAEAFEK
jgi:Flp pilus assembly protein TadB